MARSTSPRNNGLDTPRESRRSIRPNYDPEVFGRLSERFARFLGTARFLVYMTVFVLSWVFWNALAPRDLRFDDYPFIFLTLILSLQASYAAPLILLAQNRQADRDRISLNEDRAQNSRSIADTEYLTRELASLRISLGEVATRDFLRSELDDLVKELRAHVTKEIGAIAKPKTIYFTPELPKTRSGKIMRRLLRDVAEGRNLGDTTTLADASVVNELQKRAAESPSED